MSILDNAVYEDEKAAAFRHVKYIRSLRALRYVRARVFGKQTRMQYARLRNRRGIKTTRMSARRVRRLYITKIPKLSMLQVPRYCKFVKWRSRDKRLL